MSALAHGNQHGLVYTHVPLQSPRTLQAGGVARRAVGGLGGLSPTSLWRRIPCELRRDWVVVPAGILILLFTLAITITAALFATLGENSLRSFAANDVHVDVDVDVGMAVNASMNVSAGENVSTNVNVNVNVNVTGNVSVTASTTPATATATHLDHADHADHAEDVDHTRVQGNHDRSHLDLTESGDNMSMSMNMNMSKSGSGSARLDKSAVKLTLPGDHCFTANSPNSPNTTNTIANTTNTNTTNTISLHLTVTKCTSRSEGWFSEFFTLPPPNGAGHIKNEMGKILGEKLCLKVPHCVSGTPVSLEKCGPLIEANNFTVRVLSTGKVQIRTSPQCLPGHCVDMPNRDYREGQLAQVWPCSADGNESTAALLHDDERFGLGLSHTAQLAFPHLTPKAEGSKDGCVLQSVDEVLGGGLRAHVARCPVGAGGHLRLGLVSGVETEDFVGTAAYASLWLLTCVVPSPQCQCQPVQVGGELMAVERDRQGLSCGVLMLKAHPANGSCPAEFQGLQQIFAGPGTDRKGCMALKHAAQRLQTEHVGKSMLELLYLQTQTVGLRPAALAAFAAVGVANSSGLCELKNATATEEKEETEETEEAEVLQELDMQCEAETNRRLGLKVDMEGSGGRGKESFIWSLWCFEDVCTCAAVRKREQQLVWDHFRRGQKGCGVLMLSIHPDYATCPKQLERVWRAVLGKNKDNDEIDCDAGRAEAKRMADDPALTWLAKLKWFSVTLQESRLEKITKRTFERVFPFIGGVVAVFFVPAWHMVAKFAQFIIMMASNDVELRLPEEFSDFAHKFMKLESWVEPLKKLSPTRFFLDREGFVNETFAGAMRIMRDSGANPELVCYLSVLFDPLRRGLRNVTQILEANGNTNPCSAESLGLPARPRRLRSALAGQDVADEVDEADEEDDEVVVVDEAALSPEDGGLVGVEMRMRMESLLEAEAPMKEVAYNVSKYAKRQFSVNLNLQLCLCLVPLLLIFFLALAFGLALLELAYRASPRVLRWMKRPNTLPEQSPWSALFYLPHCQPHFVIPYIMELMLFNTAMAQANILRRGRLLRLDNGWALLDDAIRDEDSELAWPLRACLRIALPLISVLAQIPPLHLDHAQSRTVATVMTALNPGFLFLCWLTHYFLSTLRRHPETGRFMDPTCTGMKGLQVPFAFHKRLGRLLAFTPRVATVSTVTVGKSSGPGQGTRLFASGSDSAATAVAPWCSQCREDLDQELGYLLGENGTGASSSTSGVPLQAEQVFRAGGPDDPKAWAYRVPTRQFPLGGIGESATLRMKMSLPQGVPTSTSEPPPLQIQVQVSRGHPTVRPALRLRLPESGDHKLLPAFPGCSGGQMDLLKCVLGSALKSALQQHLKDCQGCVSGARVQCLSWTDWRWEEERWIVGALDIELGLRPGQEEADLLHLLREAENAIREKLDRESSSVLLGDAWAKTLKLKYGAGDGVGARSDSDLGPPWRFLAESQAETALADASQQPTLLEVDPNDLEDVEFDEEQQGVTGKVNFVKRAYQVAGKDPARVQAHGAAEAHSHGQGNVSILVTSGFKEDGLEDCSLEWSKQQQQQQGDSRQEGPVLALRSKLLQSARPGDAVWLWIAPSGGQEEQTRWTAAVSGARLSWEMPRAWDPARATVVERVNVEVVRVDDRGKDFPKAFCGVYQVPFPLSRGQRACLDVKLSAEDLKRMAPSKEKSVWLQQPLDQLCQDKRDLSYVVYHNDYLVQRSPECHRLATGISTLLTVWMVVLIPQCSSDRVLELDFGHNATASESASASASASRPGCLGAGHHCNTTQLQALAEQVHRETHVREGLSPVAVSLVCALLGQVLVSVWLHRELSGLSWSAVEKTFRDAVRPLWRSLNTSLTRVRISGVSAVRFKGDIGAQQAVRGALESSMGAAPGEVQTLQMEVEDLEDVDVSVVALIQVSPDPQDLQGTSVDLEVEGARKSVRLERPNLQITPGCQPREGLDRLLCMAATHGAGKASWLKDLARAARVARVAMRPPGHQNLTVYKATIPDLHPPLSQQASSEVIAGLRKALRRLGANVEQLELTPTSVHLKLTHDARRTLDPKSVVKRLIEPSETDTDFARVRTAEEVSATSTSLGRAWPGLGAVILSCLRWLEVAILLPLLVWVAWSGSSTWQQAALSVALVLLFWLLAVTLGSRVAEGILFNSCTLEAGEAVIMLPALLMQMGSMDSSTCTVLMILGVLRWGYVLCYRYTQARKKSRQKKVNRLLSDAEARAKMWAQLRQKLERYLGPGAFGGRWLWLKHRSIQAKARLTARAHHPSWWWSLLALPLLPALFLSVGWALLEVDRWYAAGGWCGSAGRDRVDRVDRADKRDRRDRRERQDDGAGWGCWWWWCCEVEVVGVVVRVLLYVLLYVLLCASLWVGWLVWKGKLTPAFLGESTQGQQDSRRLVQVPKGDTHEDTGDRVTPVFLDPASGPVQVSDVSVVDDSAACSLSATLALENGTRCEKRVLCSAGALSSPRSDRFVQVTPLQLRLEDMRDMQQQQQQQQQQQHEPDELVAVLQIMTLEDSDEHDGVCSFWRKPGLSFDDQLDLWFEQARGLFQEYNASFQPCSRVYVILGALFFGACKESHLASLARTPRRFRSERSNWINCSPVVAYMPLLTGCAARHMVPGGPLVRYLLTPPDPVELLHIVVTAEELRQVIVLPAEELRQGSQPCTEELDPPPLRETPRNRARSIREEVDSLNRKGDGRAMLLAQVLANNFVTVDSAASTFSCKLTEKGLENRDASWDVIRLMRVFPSARLRFEVHYTNRELPAEKVKKSAADMARQVKKACTLEESKDELYPGEKEEMEARMSPRGVANSLPTSPSWELIIHVEGL